MKGHGKNSSGIAGGTVVYYDKLCNKEMSSNTTKLLAGAEPLRRRRRRWWESKHLRGDKALLGGEPLPEPNPGQCVGIINELADQWAAGRNLAAQKPVERHLKVVR